MPATTSLSTPETQPSALTQRQLQTIDAAKAVELLGPDQAVKALKGAHAAERQALDQVLAEREKTGDEKAKVARNVLYNTLFASEINRGADRARLAAPVPSLPKPAAPPAFDAKLWSALAEQLAEVAASVEASIVLLNRNNFAKRLEAMEAVEQRLILRLDALESMEKIASHGDAPAVDAGLPLLPWEDVRARLKIVDAQLVALTKNDVIGRQVAGGIVVFPRAELEAAERVWSKVAQALFTDAPLDWAEARRAVSEALNGPAVVTHVVGDVEFVMDAATAAALDEDAANERNVRADTGAPRGA